MTGGATFVKGIFRLEVPASARKYEKSIYKHLMSTGTRDSNCDR